MPDGKTWFAQNLNYTAGLTYNTSSTEANGKQFIAAGNGVPAIGSYWCPPVAVGSPVVSGDAVACNTYGALYTWETAMMVDGKWSDDNHNSSTWSEPAVSAGDYVQNNGGRGTAKRGICPVNWHVPMDSEWADILNAMESGGGTAHNSGTGYKGSDSQSGAGARGKSVCRGTATDANAYWISGGTTYQGNDAFKFRVLPAGYRYYDGSYFNDRGNYATFWSSSAYSSTSAWRRSFYYSNGNVARDSYGRSRGYSVRCIRDS
jgi:uncharacterized protein (TIGR02145 family)